ncbi:MAG: hypothetical protein ACI9DC_005245 [Gammaproteobacteria bacterium]
MSCVVSDEDLRPEIRDRILSEYSEVEYGATNNRNDLMWYYEYLIQERGGVHSPEIPASIKQLNRMPMGPLKGKYAIDAFRETYNSAT